MFSLKKFYLLIDYGDGLYHYWNPREDEYQSINITKLFRSDYTDENNPTPPPTTMYTWIRLQTAFILFGLGFMFYGIILILIKYFINEDFKKASRSEKLQHIIEALNMPEAFGDWDTDHDLDVDGHFKKWKRVLIEMFVMVQLQFITNMLLLTPFFITGKSSCFTCLHKIVCS